MYNLKGKLSLGQRHALWHHEKHGRSFPGRRELRRPARRLTFIENNNSSKKSNNSSESSHVKAAAQEAAIVGASSEAGKKVPQLTQPKRAPKGVAGKSTAEAAKRSARRSSQKEHPLEQPRPLEQHKSRRRSSHEEQPQEQPAVTAVAGQQRPRQLRLIASYQNALKEEEEHKHASKTEDWTRATSAERSVLGSRSRAEGSVL